MELDKEHIRYCLLFCFIKKNLDFGRPAAVKENELLIDGKKLWKTIKTTSVNLYCIDFFYCNKKVAKNWHELLHRSNKNARVLLSIFNSNIVSSNNQYLSIYFNNFILIYFNNLIKRCTDHVNALVSFLRNSIFMRRGREKLESSINRISEVSLLYKLKHITNH